jgi:glycine cleavage system H protein
MSAKVLQDRLYTQTHEWVLLAGSQATVGITDHAQSVLTDIVYVELPSVGKRLHAGSPAAVLESVKAAADVYAPLSGKVIEVNHSLSGDPSLVNRDPYGDGWIFKLEIEDPSEVASLLAPEDYQKLLVGST